MLLDYLALLARSAGALMLFTRPYTLYQHEPELRVGLHNLAALALLFAREDNNGISFFYMQSIHMRLHYFRCAGDDGLVAKLLKLTRNRAEDAPCAWLLWVFARALNNHHCVFVKTDV